MTYLAVVAVAVALVVLLSALLAWPVPGGLLAWALLG